MGRLFGHSPSDAQDMSPSSSLDWVRNLLKQHRQSGEGSELPGRSPASVEVPYAKGKRVCSLSLSDIQENLISPRETLVRGRSGKGHYP
jgi:hypothetical protein